MWIKHLKDGQCCVMPDMYFGTEAQCNDYMATKKCKTQFKVKQYET